MYGEDHVLLRQLANAYPFTSVAALSRLVDRDTAEIEV